MASTLSVLVSAFILMVVLPHALLGVEHAQTMSNINPYGFKAVQATIQSRKARLFGCSGLDVGEVNITCTHERLESRHGLGIDCTERVPIKTVAEFVSCPPGYNLVEEYTTIVCKFPGKWDNEVFTCEEAPTEPPTTTKKPTKNSTLSTKSTTKKAANVTTNSTTKAANMTTVNVTTLPTTVAMASNSTNTTSTTVATTTNVTTAASSAVNTTAVTPAATTPVSPVYEVVVGVGNIRKSTKPMTYTEAGAECLKEGAVLMTIDTPAKESLVLAYANNSSIFVGAYNTRDILEGITGGIGKWKTDKGVLVANILGFKWVSGRPVSGTTCVVWSTVSRAHWDVLPDSCNSSTIKQPFICERP